MARRLHFFLELNAVFRDLTNSSLTLIEKQNRQRLLKKNTKKTKQKIVVGVALVVRGHVSDSSLYDSISCKKKL